MTKTIFEKIILREISATIHHENDDLIGFCSSGSITTEPTGSEFTGSFCCDLDDEWYGMDANQTSINGTVTWSVQGPGYGGNYVDTYLMLGGIPDNFAQCDDSLCKGTNPYGEVPPDYDIKGKEPVLPPPPKRRSSSNQRIRENKKTYKY